MLRAFFKFLWYVLWALFIYKMITFFKKSTYSPNKNKANTTVSGEIKKIKTYKDPICGTFVDPSIAVVYEHKGEKYYFCSEKCKEEFLKRIEK